MLKQRYVELLQMTARRDDRVARMTQRDVVIRSALQVAALAAIEASAALCRPTAGTTDRLPAVANRLFGQHLSDSVPIIILQECVEPLQPRIGQDVARALMDGITLAKDRWLPGRNERAHVLVSDEMAQDALDSLPDADVVRMFEQLSPLFPSTAPDGNTMLTLGKMQIQLDSPPVDGGEPGVLAKGPKPHDGGWWLPCVRCVDHVEFKRRLGPDSPLLLLTEESDRQGVWTEGAKKIYYVLPDRSTSVFQGRDAELRALELWLRDRDGRALTVRGEGGIGKTALVLEFLHQQLETSPEALPTFVVFHTAKKTRWGAGGLMRLHTAGESLDDAVIAVLHAMARALDTPLPFKPLQFSGVGLIKMTKRFLGLPRSDVLLVIDNAETLSERGELGQLVNEVTSHLARVIITSRDQPYNGLESTPIAVKRLSEKQAVALLRSLAAKFRAQPLLDAAQTKLGKVARSLGWRPLLIDACVRLVAEGHLGVDEAIDRLQALTGRDLGDFLYETAWKPLSEDAQQVLIALALAGGVARTEHVGWLCAALDVPLMDVEMELDTSYLLRKADGGRDFLIEQLAVEWLAKKYTEVDEAMRARIDDARKNVEEMANIRGDRSWAFFTGHERTAYRLSLAESAAAAWKLGRSIDARRRFREALEEDASNGALLERYASFLVENNQANEALTQCDRAAAKAGSEAEVRFTRAQAFAKLSRFSDAQAEIDAAGAAGKNQEECVWLRRQLVVDELASTLEGVRNRTDEVLRAVRLRAAGHLDAQFPELEEVLQRRRGGKRVATTTLTERASAYAKGGENPDLRHAAHLLIKLDVELETRRLLKERGESYPARLIHGTRSPQRDTPSHAEPDESPHFWHSDTFSGRVEWLEARPFRGKGRGSANRLHAGPA